MLAPYAEQRHAMINLCGLPQASASLGAAPLLQPLEDARIVARRRPKIPGDHAGGVPDGIAVRAAIPQVHVPTEPVDRLTADAAGARTAGVALLAIGRRWSPETRRRPIRLAAVRRTAAPFHPSWLLIGEPPRPSGRSAAACRKCTGEPVCPHRMGPPVGIDREPRHRRRETSSQGMDERGSRKHRRQRRRESRQGLPVDLVTPFGHQLRHSPQPSWPRKRKRSLKEGAAGPAPSCSDDWARPAFRFWRNLRDLRRSLVDLPAPRWRAGSALGLKTRGGADHYMAGQAPVCCFSTDFALAAQPGDSASWPYELAIRLALAFTPRVARCQEPRCRHHAPNC